MKASPQTPEPEAALRRLKWLAVILVLSNLVIGAFSVYLIQKTDRDYSVLLDDTVPVLFEVRRAGGAGGHAFRSLIAAMITNDPAKCSAELENANDALARGRTLRAQVLATTFMRQNPSLADDLRTAGETYDQQIAAIVPRVTPKTTAEDEGAALDKLQLANDEYGAAVETISTAIVDRARDTNDAYTAKTLSRSVLLLGLAGWPFLVGATVAIVTLVVVLVMLFVFKQEGMGDGP